MTDLFWTSMAVMIAFIVFRVIENKMSSKEPQSTRTLIKDSVVVYLSAAAALYAMKQLSQTVVKPSPQVAIGDPTF